MIEALTRYRGSYHHGEGQDQWNKGKVLRDSGMRAVYRNRKSDRWKIETISLQINSHVIMKSSFKSHQSTDHFSSLRNVDDYIKTEFGIGVDKPHISETIMCYR